MRDEESNWFSRWEEELPSPDELMPLSQTLITPDLALAFDIRNPNSTTINTPQAQAQAAAAAPTPPLPPPPPCSSSAAPSPPPSQPHSSDFDSTDIVSTAPGDEPARTLKRPRLVWTPQLHKRFVDAVAHLGIKNAVPKTIMQLMSVDGLTRENVASHLQKYRLYLKRMQGLSSGGGGGNGALSPADAATDHLFASAPVPHHFLHPGRPPAASDHYLPFVQVAANLQHHHHQQMAAAAVVAQQQYHHRQVGQFGSPPGRQFEHGFITGQQQQQQSVHRMGSNAAAAAPVPARQPNFLDDLENGAGGGGGGGRKVLTLFPTGDD